MNLYKVLLIVQKMGLEIKLEYLKKRKKNYKKN